MIIGIGTDLINMKRVKKIYKKYDQRFLNKILCDNEKKEFKKINSKLKKIKQINFIAKRFAAKEAIGKALGFGISFPVTFKSIEILNNNKGRPLSFFHNDLKVYFEKKKLSIHISLSDENNYVHAVAIIEV